MIGSRGDAESRGRDMNVQLSLAIDRTEKAFNAEVAKGAEDTSAAPRLRASSFGSQHGIQEGLT